MKNSRLILAGLIALASLFLTVLAHDHHEKQQKDSGHSGSHAHGTKMHEEHSEPHNTTGNTDASATYYFALELHKGWLYLHILTMLFGWVIVMPIATMLSLANSRFHAPTQTAFLVINIVGIIFSIIYNSLTPDLYPGNSHHKLGWVLLFILGAQVLVGVTTSIARRSVPSAGGMGAGWGSAERRGFMAVPTDGGDEAAERLLLNSGDSGHVSMDHGSLSSAGFDPHEEVRDWHPAATEKMPASRCWVDLSALESFLSVRAPGFVFTNRLMAACDFAYSTIARFLIPLGFTQISLGIVTGSGIFMGSSVFNGLAHFIKGGIFFLYGIVTLGRWLGAFADLGWSWNVKPALGPFASKWVHRAPSFEAVESGLIFTYGCSNVFLEHLAGWGGEWSHSDLQHLSIAFMFLGGGLLGLLVENRKIRKLLSYQFKPNADTAAASTPTTNPLPALVIFLLGILMSAHHQHSPLSSTIHTQWGTLLAAAGLFRMLTYMLLFLVPPTSTAPTRPPTEILAAFGLVAGGLVFMCSNRDTVNYLERAGFDAMFILTVTVGVTALVMSWVTVVLAVKASAVAREERAREVSSVEIM